ncbi:hypothetical protein Desor_3865 [Desulfosporosinus orientis DSM 765]|uniref:Uncharacterized protein n=1 Tax=Desulfosporosinus orientis (strain ATCC 19365 / DSM 765 / NCIMB 8382 / VKM B-1628 / Singapore I) TaxID=768706 RepID=G7WBR8_DESOD|nr:hypothetical protein [Desulfosporosinus orientis]AET69315.1 hypothetical protein Desor_3865 [Desulfosporosinus orientis DSM 765]
MLLNTVKTVFVIAFMASISLAIVIGKSDKDATLPKYLMPSENFVILIAVAEYGIVYGAAAPPLAVVAAIAPYTVALRL